MSCGEGCRFGSDPALLWLWRRPVATAPIRPLAWEPPYAAGVALKRQKDQKKKALNILFRMLHRFKLKNNRIVSKNLEIKHLMDGSME